jgi:hypothetical protein
MLKIITVDKNIGLTEIDNLYTDLYRAIRMNTLIDVLIPKELKKNYLGITPNLIQFIATWVRYKNSGKLRIDIENPSEELVNEIYENEFIFPIVSLVWDSNVVFDKSGKNNLRENFKSNQAVSLRSFPLFRSAVPVSRASFRSTGTSTAQENNRFEKKPLFSCAVIVPHLHTVTSCVRRDYYIHNTASFVALRKLRFTPFSSIMSAVPC